MPRLDDDPCEDELAAFRALRGVALAIFWAFCPNGAVNDSDLAEITGDTKNKLNAAYRTLKKAVEYYQGQDEHLSTYDPLPGRPFARKKKGS